MCFHDPSYTFFLFLLLSDDILNKDCGISETFNNYFVNITKDLGIFDWADDSSDRSNIFIRMFSFSNQPSIEIVKDKYQNSFNFKFEPVITDFKSCYKRSSGDYQQKLLRLQK